MTHDLCWLILPTIAAQNRLEAAERMLQKKFAVTKELRLELAAACTADDDDVRERDALLAKVDYFEGLDLRSEEEFESEVEKLEACLSGLGVRRVIRYRPIYLTHHGLPDSH